MFTILLVEDNENIQKLNKEMLEEEGGYKVLTAMSLRQAKECFNCAAPDLIVLDIMLPDGSGLDFLRELRLAGSDVPVMLLTAPSETSDEVRGIREGGDDYMTKPYDNDVLLVRIKKLLKQRRKADRRVKDAMSQSEVVQYGSLVVNNLTRRASLGGKDAGLTPKEFSVLAYFLKNIDKPLTAEEIYENVWGLDAVNFTGTVKVHINRLREKLRMDDEIALILETYGRKFYVCRLTYEEGWWTAEGKAVTKK